MKTVLRADFGGGEVIEFKAHTATPPSNQIFHAARLLTTYAKRVQEKEMEQAKEGSE